MSLGEFLAELRHRGVLKVATVYVATGVVLLEAGSRLLHNFEAPHWVIKVFTALVIVALPIAALMAWAFAGVSTAQDPISQRATDKGRATRWRTT